MNVTGDAVYLPCEEMLRKIYMLFSVHVNELHSIQFVVWHGCVMINTLDFHSTPSHSPFRGE